MAVFTDLDQIILKVVAELQKTQKNNAILKENEQK